MSWTRVRRRGLWLTVGAALLATGPVEPQEPGGGRSARSPLAPAQGSRRTPPRLEPVAETSLLMQGIALPNFQGIQKNLQEPPADVETWVFLRGQALIVAESGNLLLMRPPRHAGLDAWMELATALRTAAVRLARAAAARDYPASRQRLVEVTNACNRCHQTFRVAQQLSPFGD